MNKLSKIELRELKHFDSFAEYYDYNYNYSIPFNQYKIKKKCKELLDIIKDNFSYKELELLEIGSGTGEYTKNIARGLPRSRIFSLDISSLMLKLARQKCNKCRNISYHLSSAYDTKFPKNKFDVVFGFYVLHHLDIKKVKKEIQRILKPGGLVIFYEPNVLNPIVYMIKNSKSLKKKVGDSPKEYAINPLRVAEDFGSDFDVVSIAQTEFVWPLFFLPTQLLIFIDKLLNLLRYIPVINLFSGSVRLCLIKKK